MAIKHITYTKESGRSEFNNNWTNETLHREDGPARIVVILKNENIINFFTEYFIDGLPFKENGPAIIEYTAHIKTHKLEIIKEDFYINGNYVSKAQWKAMHFNKIMEIL